MNERAYRYLTQGQRRKYNRCIERRYFNKFDRLCFEFARFLGLKRD